MTARAIEHLRSGRFALLGMVHLLPLPGSAGWAGSMDEVLSTAVTDARALVDAGFDGMIVENYGDAPFLPGSLPPETVAALALAVRVVREELGPEPLVGVDALRNDARAGLGVAVACGADLIRVNVHVGSMWTDQGLIEGRAWETVRERVHLGADVAILADVLVKHANPPVSLDPAVAAEETVSRGGADAVIVTGPATGTPVEPERLERIAASVEAPVLVGSGVTPEQLAALMKHASGAIVGSSIKVGGTTGRPVDPEKAQRLTSARDALAGGDRP